MNYNKNRLQFVHCNTLFTTSEEAKTYIKGQMEQIDRPALYAEPMILKYGNVDSPNILIAIGSVGDGESISTKNKTYFIDSSKIEEDLKVLFEETDIAKQEIAKLQGLISNIILSCGIKEDGTYAVATDDAILKNATSLFTADKELSKYVQELAAKSSLNVKNGETLSFDLNKADSGMTLTGEVIIAPSKIVNNNVLPNVILHESNGIFTNVDLNYDTEEAQLKLAINGDEKVLQLPHETHVIKGVYDEKIESIVLTFNREIEFKDDNDVTVVSNKLNINLGKLIEEWTVLGNNSDTPIVLTREKVSVSELLANANNERALNVWQDILKADVRVASVEQVPNNILKKDHTGRFLYVDGVAKDIKYWKNGVEINVQEALDSVETKVSNSVGNILFKRNDGLYGTTDLSYIAAENSLIFKTSTKEGGENQTKIKLNSVSFINGAYYDSSTEEIVIDYTDATGAAQKLRIPITGILSEWDVNNTNATVTLVKTRAVGSGEDKLSANVNIASGTQDNILEIRGHALYVNGTAENIRFSGTSSVFNEIVTEQNRAKTSETTISNSVIAETNRAKDVEGTILTKVHEEADRAIASETSIKSKADATELALSNEVTRAKEEEAKIDAKVNAETTRAVGAETVLDGKMTTFASDLSNEVTRATTSETSISNNLDIEAARAKAEESRIETKLDGEIILSVENNTRLTSDVKTVTDGLASEVARANDAEIAISIKANATELALSNEVTRAKEEEVKIDAKVNAETARAVGAETVLDGKMTTFASDLANEVTRATAIETSISNTLEAEVTRAKTEESRIETKLDGEITLSVENNTRLTSDVKTVKDGLSSEVARAKDVENTIKTKADATELALSNEVTRAKEEEVKISTKATTTEASLVTEVARALDVENTIKAKADATELALTNEIIRAKEEEVKIDTKANFNGGKIDGEISRAVDAEAVLRQSISDVKFENSFTTNDTGTIAFNKVNSPTGSLLTAEVIVSTNDDHNLINSNGQALYASVTLNYDEGTNTLKFKASDGTDKDIKLNAGSIIDSMHYDAEKEEIVILYTDAQGNKQEIRFSARTLFNTWDVADTHPGAVKLIKTIGVGSEHDKLSAEVMITNLPSGNLLSNVGGSLYVSNQAKDIILANGDTVEEAIKVVKGDLAQEIINRTDGDINLQVQITEISGKTKECDSAIKALQDKDIVQDTQIAGLETRVNELKANDANQDVKILAIEKDNIIIKDEQRIIQEHLVNIDAKNVDQDAAILEAQKDIDNLELKTNISTIETLSVKMEYNSTINSANIQANTKISNETLNLIVINKAGDDIDNLGNGLLFDGSIDYGTF